MTKRRKLMLMDNLTDERIARLTPDQRDYFLRVMKAARRLIWRRKNWCQGFMRLSDGNGEHVQRCAMGAFNQAMSDITWPCSMPSPPMLALLTRYCGAMYDRDVVSVNDYDRVRPHLAHRQIMRLFTGLIRMLEPPAPPLADDTVVLELERSKEDA